MVDYAEFKALAPFIKLVEDSLAGLADGDRYFDLFADDVVMEFVYAPPGTPPELRGRQAIIDSFRGYGRIITLDRMSDAKVYATATPGVVILEYASHGTGVTTGRPYHQHYVSIVTIRDRRIVHWRDYSNPLVVIDTIGDGQAMAKAMFSGT
ncbi:nuclear transport factor 2 family protein [Streptomyces sp. NPDC058371]|uniref:nuclear transport factor 2 family protein n=1 Tax=Streptomyces sp. NPDC058371 TaxID=3346463 RepID=UPI0036673830